MKSITSENFPPKMLAIFEGFNKLQNQGIKAEDIKVSDIAIAAGIGKGTIYEYFSSKEEIIIKSLAYEYVQEIARLKDLVISAGTFMDKIDKIMEWLERNVQKKFVIKEIINGNEKLELMSKMSCEELFGEKSNKDLITEIGNLIVESGIKEGLIEKPQSQLKQDMIIAGVAAGLLYYLARAEKYTGQTYEEARDYSKEMLLILLQGDSPAKKDGGNIL